MNFSSFIRNYRIEILLFLGALLLRAVFAFVVQLSSGAHGFVSHADSNVFYFQTAKNLLDHHAFSLAQSPPFIPGSYHTPLYPFFLAALLLINIPLLGIAIIQCIFAALTVVLVYLVAANIFDKRVALISALLAMIEPMSIYWSSMLMSDTLFAFLLTLSVYFLVKDKPYSSMFVLGLGALTRPINLYFMPIFIGMVAYQAYANKSSTKDVIYRSALSIIIFVLTISPWVVRNKIVFDHWALSSAGWYEVYVGPLPEFAKMRGIPFKIVESPPNPDFSRLSFSFEPVYKDAVTSMIVQDPVGYGIVHGMRAIRSLFTNRFDYLVHVVLESELPDLYARIPSVGISGLLFLGGAFWTTVYLLCFASFAERRTRNWWAFFVLLIGTNAMLSGAVNPHGAEMSRYSLGLYPAFFSFAAFGAILLLSQIKRMYYRGIQKKV